MLGKNVEIVDGANFYDGMVGTVIQEEPRTVLVEILLRGGNHRVMFYKGQVSFVLDY